MGRKRRDPEDTPVAEKILDAASLLFSTVGYEQTSMKAIAREADITPGALYYHYANKQEIVFRTLERAVVELMERTAEAVAHEGNASQALRAFVDAHITYQLTSLNTVAPVYTALVYGMRHQVGILDSKQLERLRSVERAHLDTLRGTLRRGIASKDFVDQSPTLTSFAIIGMCEHVTNWFTKDGGMTVTEVAAFFSDQALVIARGDSHRAKPRRRTGPA